MKLSKMIRELAAELDEHGDVEVWFVDDQQMYIPHTVEYCFGEVHIKAEGV